VSEPEKKDPAAAPKQPIIIKNVKKGHGGAHGGSWKVAYADFVTAMMAFFLLMWLLNSLAPKQRDALSNYFQHFNIFDKAGVSFIEKGGTSKDAPGMDAKDLPKETHGQPGLPPESFAGERMIPYELRGSAVSPGQFADEMKHEVDEKMSSMKDQIQIETTDDGVRIQLVDRQGRPMFESGSGKPTELGKRALDFVAESLRGLPNLVAIEGHTDALGTHRGDRGNWQLSTERALQARDALEGKGVNPQRFLRVSGYADTRLYNEADPTDPRNRRISVMVWFPDSKVAREQEGGSPASTEQK
jgi:chemotaxis protein MotB